MKRLLSSLALLVGCSSPPSSNTGCEERGCPTGASCLQGLCLADAPEDFTVALRFVPPAGQGPSQWQGPTRLSELGDVFVFDRLVDVHGSLRGDALPFSPGARIDLVRPGPVPDRLPQAFGASTLDGDFRLQVTPGDDYLLTAVPVSVNSAWAPVRMELDVDQAIDIDLDLPETIRVHGTIHRAGEDGEGMEDVRIWAVDAPTGGIISSVAVSGDPDPQVQGDFDVHMFSSARTFVLRTAGTVDSPALPTVDFGPFDVSTLLVQDGALQIPLAAMTYPTLGVYVEFSGSVEGRSRGGERVAVGGASLRFSSSDLGDPGIADVLGSVEMITNTRDDGTFEIHLYKGTYDVEVVPPANAEYADLGVARVSQFVNAGPSHVLQGAVIEVPPRSTLAGRIVDQDDQPLEGASVMVAGGGDLSNLAVAAGEPRNRSASAATTAEGAFLVQVDQGHFDVSVQPGPSAGLPWGIFPEVLVAEDVVPDQTFVVTPGRRLRGTVRDAENQAASGVTVEVWGIRDDGSSVVCARAVTDGSGAYDILVPASI